MPPWAKTVPLPSNPLGEILLWSGWLSSGWRWLFSADFRLQKRARWRQWPAPLVWLDVAGGVVVWSVQLGLALLLGYLAFR